MSGGKIHPPGKDMLNNPLYKKIVKDKNVIKMAEKMMAGTKGGKMPDLSAMGDLMKNPTMEHVAKNPEVLQQGVKFMKENPAAREALGATLPKGVNPDTAINALEWVAWLTVTYSKLKKYFPYVKYSVIIFLLYWLYYKTKSWFGTNEEVVEEPLVYG